MRIQNYDTHYASIQTVLVYPYYIPNTTINPRSHESHSRDAEQAKLKTKRPKTTRQSKLMNKWERDSGRAARKNVSDQQRRRVRRAVELFMSRTFVTAKAYLYLSAPSDTKKRRRLHNRRRFDEKDRLIPRRRGE